MVQAADNPPKDVSAEATTTAPGNSVNGSDILLSNPQDSLDTIRAGQKQHHLSSSQDYDRLTDAMRLAHLVSTPENATPVGVVDLEFGRYYIDLPQLDAISYSKAKDNIEDAVQIYERNHNRRSELSALNEELELVQKMNPNPTVKPNEKTEAQQLQERISKLTQFDKALDEYGEATDGKSNDNVIATSLDHLGKAYASQNNKEQADKSFQKAIYLLDHCETNDKDATLQVLKDYSAFLHTTGYGDPIFIDDRIKQLGGTDGAQSVSNPTEPAKQDEVATPASNAATNEVATPTSNAATNEVATPTSNAATNEVATPTSNAATNEVATPTTNAATNEVATPTTNAATNDVSSSTHEAPTSAPDNPVVPNERASESSTDDPAKISAIETQLQRNYNLTLEMFGNSSDQAAEAACQMANFYKSKGPGFEDQALKFYAQALVVYDRPDRPLTFEITTLTKYADLLQSSDPQRANALRDRSEALFSLGAYTQTFEEEMMTRESTPSPSSLCNLALSYAKVGNISKANALFAEAVTMHVNDQPGNSDSTYERYAEYLKSQGRNQEAQHFMDLYNAESAASQVASNNHP